MGELRVSDPELLENIDHLESRLLAYEAALAKGHDDTALVQFIFRYAHNLKSSLAMLGFADASRLLHRVETCFDLVRNARKRATAALCRAAVGVVDVLRTHLASEEGSPLGDTGAVDAVFEDFSTTGNDSDVRVALPFPLVPDEALDLYRNLRSGASLRLVERLVSTNLSPDFFSRLPIFEQVRSAGTLIAFRPAWEDLSKDQHETVLALVLATSLDEAALTKALGGPSRPLVVPLPKRLFINGELSSAARQAAEAAGYQGVPDLPSHEAAIVLCPPNGSVLDGLEGYRRDALACLVLLPHDSPVSTALDVLDRGADGVALGLHAIAAETRALESWFLTALMPVPAKEEP